MPNFTDRVMELFAIIAALTSGLAVAHAVATFMRRNGNRADGHGNGQSAGHWSPPPQTQSGAGLHTAHPARQSD